MLVIAGCGGGGTSAVTPSSGSLDPLRRSVAPATASPNGTFYVSQTARSAASSTSATSITVTLGKAPVAGDVVIAAVAYMGSSTTITAPSGWTALESKQAPLDNNAIGQATFYHVAASGEAGSYSFGSNAPSPLTVGAQDVVGASTTNPIAGHVLGTALTGYSATTGALSATGALPVAFLMQFCYDNLAAGYGSSPSWSGNTTVEYSAANQFVQETLNGSITSSTVSVTESWTGGDNSAQISELVLINPGNGGATGQSTPTPAPSATSTSVASGSGGNSGYTYAGCPVFPGTAGGHSGGWYNTDVSSAPVQSNSASLIADYTGSGGTTSGFRVSVNLPALEVVNTPSSVNLYPIQSSNDPAETSSMPGPASIYSGSGTPGTGALMIEGSAGSDGHYHVVNTSTCQYWSSGATAWSGSGFSVWNAGLYNLTQPQPLTSNYGAVADCCGIPMVAFLIKPSELKAGVINHALGWVSPGNEGGISPVDPNSFVSPAVEAQGGAACTSPAPCMPYGAHIRLKASFNDSNFSPSARAVAEALKHYGAYLMDTGCCLSISYLAQDWSGINVDTLWSSTDESYINTINMSNMDVISPANSNAPN